MISLSSFIYDQRLTKKIMKNNECCKKCRKSKEGMIMETRFPPLVLFDFSSFFLPCPFQMAYPFPLCIQNVLEFYFLL